MKKLLKNTAFATLLTVVMLISFFNFPASTDAATTCPTGPGWTTGPGRFLTSRQTACYFNGEYLGWASPDDTPLNCPSGSTSIYSGGNQTCIDNSTGRGVEAVDNKNLATCARASLFSTDDWGDCFLATVSVTIGTAIIQILSSIMWIADSFLSFVIKKTVLIEGFSTVYKEIRGPIESTWVFIRDLINIGIIGMFVFIAISIILGIKQYGEKKLIANVLIVAILINFSFLFTRIIINASNLFTTNIYNQMIVPLIPAGTTGGDTPNIGGRYITDLRVQSLLDAGSTLTQRYNDGKESLGALWMHVFVSSFVILGVTIAFLFAGVILLSRFIVLVATLLLSAAAFGSFIHPSTKWVWDKWWSALLKNAVLAPVFFIFLWVSLKTSDSIGKAVEAAGSWGQVSVGYTSNADAGTVGLLINYLLVLGLLFLGVFLAKNLSDSLAMRISGGIVFGLTGGAMSALGLGTNYLAYRNQKFIERRLEKVKRDTSLDENEKARKVAALSGRLDRAKAATKRDYNAFNMDAIKTGMKSAVGLSGISAGQTKNTSYAKMVDEHGKKLAERYQAAELSKEDRDAMHKRANEERESATAMKKSAEANKEAAQATKDAAETQKKAAQDQVRLAKTKEETHITTKQQQDAEDETTIRGGGPGTEAARSRIDRNKRLADELTKQRMDADENLSKVLARHANADYDGPLAAATKKLNEAAKKEKEAIAAADAVSGHINRFNTALNKRIKNASWNPDYSKAALKQIRAHHKQERIKNTLAAAGGDHDDGHGGAKKDTQAADQKAEPAH